jgi:hypothetical protein
MKKLFTLYAIVFLFGEVSGYIKSGSWLIRDWGFYTSKYVSIWWIVMGFAATLYCMVDAIMKDHKQEVEAYNQSR